MSVLWFAIPVALPLTVVVVLYREAAKERREQCEGEREGTC